MKKIVFLLFVILASPLIDAIIVKLGELDDYAIGDYLVKELNYTNCNGCQVRKHIFSCNGCDSENICTNFCTRYKCTEADYETSSKKCNCNSCNVKLNGKYTYI